MLLNYLGIVLLLSLGHLSSSALVKKVQKREDVRDHKCEHDGGNLQIDCGEGHYISMFDGGYGSDDENTCGSGVNDCLADNSEEMIRDHCDGKQSCTIYNGNGVYGDPCYGVTKFVWIDYECKEGSTRSYTCEHSGDLSLSCPEGTNLDITEAGYGAEDETLCSVAKPDTYCYADGSEELIRNSCQGLSECTVTNGNVDFGDPCVGVQKYVYAQYTCEAPREVEVGCAAI